MQRSLTQVLGFLLVLCSAAALLHVTIALGSSRGYGDSPHTTQIVRSYYASLNGVLAGRQDDDRYLLTPGQFAGLDVDAALILGALRDTYPSLRLAPGEISGSGSLALAQVSAQHGEAQLPQWINDGAGLPFPSSIDSLRIENGAVVEQRSSARVGVLAQTLAGNGIDFELERPARLKVAELVLNVSEPSQAFVAVPGPGFVVPLEGAFEVMANGLLRWSGPAHETSGLLPQGERTVFTGQQVLVIPQGQAVIWPVGNAPVRLLALAMIPTQPETGSDDRYVDPRAPETFDEILNRLETGDEPERMWFGSMHVLSSVPQELPPGPLTMDLTRVFVPAGETVRLSPDGAHLIAMRQEGDAWSQLDALVMTNTSGSIWILETVRVCRRDSDTVGPVSVS